MRTLYPSSLLLQAEKGSFLGAEAAFKGKEVGYPGGPFDPFNLSRCAPPLLPAPSC